MIMKCSVEGVSWHVMVLDHGSRQAIGTVECAKYAHMLHPAAHPRRSLDADEVCGSTKISRFRGGSWYRLVRASLEAIKRRPDALMQPVNHQRHRLKKTQLAWKVLV